MLNFNGCNILLINIFWEGKFYFHSGLSSIIPPSGNSFFNFLFSTNLLIVYICVQSIIFIMILDYSSLYLLSIV